MAMFRGVKIKLHYQVKTCLTQLSSLFMAQYFIYYQLTSCQHEVLYFIVTLCVTIIRNSQSES